MSFNYKISAILIIATCLNISNLVNGALDPTFEALLDKYINSTFMPANNLPGLGITIVKGREVALAKGYGYSDLSNGIKINETSLFGLGSLSKTIISTIALKVLAEHYRANGKGILDDPIKNVAPAFKFSSIDKYRKNSMRFRDLLSHSTCQCQSQLNLFVGASNSSEELAYRARYEEQCCRFRSYKQSFSNTQYVVATEALASIAGEDWISLAERSMREMGLPTAIIYKNDGSHEKLNLAQGFYNRNGTNMKYNMKLLRKFGNAGAIAASVQDIGAYMLFNINLGMFNGAEVVPSDWLQWQYDVTIPTEFENFKKTKDERSTGVFGYAFGAYVSAYEDWMWIQQPGVMGPYRSKLSAFPTKDMAFFTVTNQASLNKITQDELHMTIFEAIKLFEAGDLDPFNKTFNASKIPRVIVKAEQIEREMWLPRLKNPTYVYPNVSNPWFNASTLAGVYGNPVDGELNIITDASNTTLNVHYGDWGIGVLNFARENTYDINWTTDINHQFYAAGVEAPSFKIHFQTNETLVLLQNGGILSTFKKNALLDSEPVDPFESNSCSIDKELYL